MLRNEPFHLHSDHPEREACLLLHGLGGGAYEMQLLGQHLHERGWTVRAINYPGHDAPAQQMPPSTWRQWYGHAEETYRELAAQYKGVTAIGFSTGCLLSLRLACEYQIEKLVLLSPFMGVRHQWYYLLPAEAYLFSLGHFIDNVPRRQPPVRDQHMRRHAKNASFLGSFNLPAARSAVSLVREIKKELHRVQTPTLIVQSHGDSVVDPAGARLIHEKLGSKVKRLHWVTESDHVLPLDVEREEVFGEIERFLAEA